MPSTTARAFRTTEVDVPAFVDHARRLNKEAVRIVKAPSGEEMKVLARQGLVSVLDELEATIKVLRVATIEASSMSHPIRGSKVGKLTARQDDPSLVLDTTEVMIKKKQLVSPSEFQRLMGWTSRQAVWKAVDSHRIFYLDYKAERYFPTFYANPAYDRKHLEAVTKVLGNLPGGSKLQFFLSGKGSLGGETPLQALAAGRATKVKDVAAAFAEVPAEA